jgi:hypothetical protein
LCLALIDHHLAFDKRGHLDPVSLGEVADQVIDVRVQQPVCIHASNFGLHPFRLLSLYGEGVYATE